MPRLVFEGVEVGGQSLQLGKGLECFTAQVASRWRQGPRGADAAGSGRYPGPRPAQGGAADAGGGRWLGRTTWWLYQEAPGDLVFSAAPGTLVLSVRVDGVPVRGSWAGPAWVVPVEDPTGRTVTLYWSGEPDGTAPGLALAGEEGARLLRTVDRPRPTGTAGAEEAVREELDRADAELGLCRLLLESGGAPAAEALRAKPAPPRRLL